MLTDIILPNREAINAYALRRIRDGGDYSIYDGRKAKPDGATWTDEHEPHPVTDFEQGGHKGL